MFFLIFAHGLDHQRSHRRPEIEGRRDGKRHHQVFGRDDLGRLSAIFDIFLSTRSPLGQPFS